MAAYDDSEFEYDPAAFGADVVPGSAAAADVSSSEPDDPDDSDFVLSGMDGGGGGGGGGGDDDDDSDSDFEVASAKKKRKRKPPAKKRKAAAQKPAAKKAKTTAKAKKAPAKKNKKTKQAAAAAASPGSAGGPDASAAAAAAAAATEQDPEDTVKKASGGSKGKSKKKKKAPAKAKKKKTAAAKKTTTKTKTKKLTGAALKAKVVEYLEGSNRPHSEKEVWENMHKPISCAKLKALLIELAAAGTISRKENGKFNVFFAEQGQYAEFTAASILALEADAETARLALQQRKAAKSLLAKDVSALQARPTLDVLRTRVTETAGKLTEAEAKHAAATGAGAAAVDPQAREKLIKTGRELLKLYKTRTSNLVDVVDQMAEGKNCKPAKIYADLDLEAEASISFKEAKARFTELVGKNTGGGAKRGGAAGRWRR